MANYAPFDVETVGGHTFSRAFPCKNVYYGPTETEAFRCPDHGIGISGGLPKPSENEEVDSSPDPDTMGIGSHDSEESMNASK